MKLYAGKWFVAVRFKNDKCVGVGRPSEKLLAEADLSRPNSFNR